MESTQFFLVPLTLTSWRASLRWLRVTLISDASILSILSSSLSALRPASRQTSAISAPENPSESLARVSIPLIACSSCCIFAMLILKMSFLVSSLGSGTWTSLSNLPGLNKAVSIMSRRLVAPTTMTYARDSTPSISLSSWQRALSETFVSSSPL